MSKLTQKAHRCTVRLGAIPLEIFLLEDGNYVLSQEGVSLAVETGETNARDWLKSKSPEALPYKEFTLVKVMVSGTKTRITCVPIEIAAAFWTKEALKGNEKAARLLGACAAEAIERRADKEFGRIRTEEERNDRLEARVEGKVTRRKLTDGIKEYLLCHPELSDNYRKYIYSNVSDLLNRALFGKSSRQLLEERGVNQLRDNFTADELKEIERREDFAVKLIDKLDTEPMDAMDQAIAFWS